MADLNKKNILLRYYRRYFSVRQYYKRYFSNGGINLISLLGLSFVILKLAHQITWSWIWVTIPFWGVFALIIILAFIMLIFSFLPSE